MNIFKVRGVLKKEAFCVAWFEGKGTCGRCFDGKANVVLKEWRIK